MPSRQEVSVAVKAHIPSQIQLNRIWTEITGMGEGTDKDWTTDVFLIVVYVAIRAIAVDRIKSVSAMADGPGKQKIKSELLDMVNSLPNTFARPACSRQIVPQDQQGDMRAEHLINYLKLGYETVIQTMADIGDAELSEYVERVFHHEKGYPRTVNYAQSYIPLKTRTAKKVLDSMLDGFTNTNIFTGHKDESSCRDQLKADWAKASDQDKRKVLVNILGRLVSELHLTGYKPAQFEAFVKHNWSQFQGAFVGIIAMPDLEYSLKGELKSIAKEMDDWSYIGR